VLVVNSHNGGKVTIPVDFIKPFFGRYIKRFKARCFSPILWCCFHRYYSVVGYQCTLAPPLRVKDA
jgi:hypothetical protein